MPRNDSRAKKTMILLAAAMLTLGACAQAEEKQKESNLLEMESVRAEESMLREREEESARIEESILLQRQEEEALRQAELRRQEAQLRKEANPRNIPVLTYHGVEQASDSDYVVATDSFRHMLDSLQSRGYETIHMRDLYEHIYEGKILPPKPVLITFDDGYLNNYTIMYPVLKEKNMKATIFVITSKVGVGENKFSWDMAREMVQSGLVDIESHTWDGHYDITGAGGIVGPSVSTQMEGEPTEQFHQRVLDDLILSRAVIKEQVGQTSYAFSYPAGNYTEEMAALVERAGFSMAFIGEGAKLNQTMTLHPFYLDRYHASRVLDIEKLLNELDAAPAPQSAPETEMRPASMQEETTLQ